VCSYMPVVCVYYPLCRRGYAGVSVCICVCVCVCVCACMCEIVNKYVCVCVIAYLWCVYFVLSVVEAMQVYVSVSVCACL